MDPFWLVLALPFGWSSLYPAMRPLRLCHGSLVIPKFVRREFRLPVAEIVTLEVGTFRWSGLSGYSGTALAIHTDGVRMLVQHSLYCGERRINEWVDVIVAAEGFTGGVRRTDRKERWEGSHDWPGRGGLGL